MSSVQANAPTTGEFQNALKNMKSGRLSDWYEVATCVADANRKGRTFVWLANQVGHDQSTVRRWVFAVGRITRDEILALERWRDIDGACIQRAHVLELAYFTPRRREALLREMEAGRWTVAMLRRERASLGSDDAA
jgi:hypothetical protein